MKRFLLFAIIVLGNACACLAQRHVPLTKDRNAMRLGDVVSKRVMQAPCCLDDTTAAYDFSAACLASPTVRQEMMSFTEDTAAVVSCEDGTRQYYMSRGDTLLYGGFENKLIKMLYDMPETRLTYPVADDSLWQGLFHGTGTFCDKFFIHTFGRYKTRARRCRAVTLPDGSVIGGCMMLHTTRVVSNIYYPIDSVRNASRFTVQHFTADSIVAYMQADSVLLQEDFYQVYVPGYRYPVIEQREVCSDGAVARQMLYAQCDDQPGIALDTENMALRHALEKERETDNGSGGGAAGEAGRPLSYSMAFDKEARMLAVGYTAHYSGRLVFMLSDTMGRVINIRNAMVHDGGSDRVVIDCASLKHGHYVLYINADNEIFAEKFAID